MGLLGTLFAAFKKPQPAAPATGSSKVEADIRKAADWIAIALISSGYKADFSVASLAEVDRFFDDQVVDGKPSPTGLLSADLGSRLFALGGYVGEVIRRSAGGSWSGNDKDPEAEINIALQLSSGVTLWPVQRVIKRLKNGREDGVVTYADAVINA